MLWRKFWLRHHECGTIFIGLFLCTAALVSHAPITCSSTSVHLNLIVAKACLLLFWLADFDLMVLISQCFFITNLLSTFRTPRSKEKMALILTLLRDHSDRSFFHRQRKRWVSMLTVTTINILLLNRCERVFRLLWRADKRCSRIVDILSIERIPKLLVRVKTHVWPSRASRWTDAVSQDWW